MQKTNGTSEDEIVYLSPAIKLEAAGYDGNPLDKQVDGNHYQKLGLYQPWLVLKQWMTQEELKGAMKKEVIAYLAREADKGGRKDIEKAAHTLQIYLELTKDDHHG